MKRSVCVRASHTWSGHWRCTAEHDSRPSMCCSTCKHANQTDVSQALRHHRLVFPLPTMAGSIAHWDAGEISRFPAEPSFGIVLFTDMQLTSRRSCVSATTHTREHNARARYTISFATTNDRTTARQTFSCVRHD